MEDRGVSSPLIGGAVAQPSGVRRLTVQDIHRQAAFRAAA